MKKFLSLLLAAAMLCTLLVGCGSKSDDSNGDYKPFVEVQGVSDDTILVGNTAATTGAYATVGVPFNAGMEAAFKAYNDAGGFQGKSIVLKHYDDGFDGAQGMTYTKQLVETDKVFAIVGHFGTNTVGATLDYLKEKHWIENTHRGLRFLSLSRKKLCRMISRQPVQKHVCTRPSKRNPK